MILSSSLAGLAFTSFSVLTASAHSLNPHDLFALSHHVHNHRSSPSLEYGNNYLKPLPNLARWAEFNGPSSYYGGRRNRRKVEDGTDDGSTGARPSPLPLLNGETITQTVAQQIKNDVNSVVDSFAGLPPDVSNVLKTAISNIMNQQIYTQDPSKQYEIVSNNILDKLNTLEQSLPATLLNLQSPLDDTADFDALRNCIMTIVAMGGLTSPDQGTCLSQSGYTLDSLKQQFNDFVDINTFVIPANAMNDAVKGINKFLDENELNPPLEYLIGNATQSLQNVVLSVQAKERDATQKAFECFVEALQTISTKSLAERERLCNTGNGQGVQGSSLADLEEAFQDKANQYLGVLPPALAYNIQRIGLTSITLATGSYDSNVRDLVNSAILSATSATSGESATIVGDLIKCLNTIYDATAQDTCNANSNPEILEHNENIYYNYLAQFVSILPKSLVQNLNTTVQSQLEGDNGADAEALRAQLDSLWKQASLGSDYEACEIEFNQCVVKAMTEGSVTTSCYDSKGSACQALPALAPGQIESGNPYGEIAKGLAGAGGFGGAKRHKRFARAVKKLADDHAVARKRSQNPVPRSGLELMA